MQRVELRTGVWYNDRQTTLTFPDEWDVAAYWPETPPALTDAQIAEGLASPVGQPSLAELAAGKKKPLIIVDDLTRPTPVHKILPHLLRALEDAGHDVAAVRVLVATGTHGKQDADALANKLGRDIFDRCKVILHNDRGRTTFWGKTSFGTPVYVNPQVKDSDLVIGIGGVYPQHSTGFGGGGKLALGVLGRRTIKHLHFGHAAVGGNYNIDNDFRRNVTEIAQMIGLHTIVTVHVDAGLEVVKIVSGDYTRYYTEAAKFSREIYNAPTPDDADVVIANGYPSDISYTFMRKGNKPILAAPPGATRIMIGSNHGGLGHHGLYPQGRNPRWTAYKELWDRVSIMEPGVIARKIIKNLVPRRRKSSAAASPAASPPVHNATMWIYVPSGGCVDLPEMSGVGLIDDWNKVLERIRADHGGKDRIKVRIYPCASLQCLETSAVDVGIGAT